MVEKSKEETKQKSHNKEKEEYTVNKIKLTNFEILGTLGTGSFGRVRLAQHKKTGKFWAMKILKKSEIVRLKQVDHIINEFSILAVIEHPFLVGLSGFNQDPRYLYFLMEFIVGGELYGYMRTEVKLQPDTARFYAAQVIAMFEYIHSKNIIYRDLKPENLLIGKNGYLKLTDFGFAKYCATRTYTLCGTPEYLAPEILLNKGHGKPVDWWCLGILIYEMLSGVDPFTDEDPMTIYQKILKGVVKFPRSFEKNAKSLVKHLLVADTTRRYGCMKGGADDVKAHRWFHGLSFKKMLLFDVEAPYKPYVKAPDDTTNFPDFPDSDTLPPALKPKEDPFIEW